MSLRGVQRGARRPPQHRDPVDKKGASEVMQTVPVCITPPGEVVVELDELWTFVGKKKQARWLWIALERSTRKGKSLGSG